MVPGRLVVEVVPGRVVVEVVPGSVFVMVLGNPWLPTTAPTATPTTATPVAEINCLRDIPLFSLDINFPHYFILNFEKL